MRLLVYVRQLASGRVWEGTVEAEGPFNGQLAVLEYMSAHGVDPAGFEFLGYVPTLEAVRELTAPQISALPELLDMDGRRPRS